MNEELTEEEFISKMKELGRPDNIINNGVEFSRKTKLPNYTLYMIYSGNVYFVDEDRWYKEHREEMEALGSTPDGT